MDNNLIWSLFNDKDGILWVGTNNGLNKFIPESNTFHRINNSLINGSVFYINAYQNNKNILWLCTEFGLIRFNKNTEVCYKYNNDLKRESVFCALPDKKGNLWLSTNRGLFQFNPETGKLRSFFESDGLPSNEFNYAAFSKNYKTNELIFGGVNGLVIFKPGDIQRNTLPPSVVLTDFKIFNQSIGIDNYHLKKSITEAEKINLSYKDNIFTFSFAALDFLAPDKNTYAFKMENLNNEWNYIDNRRFTTYANLPPGNYTFRVKAANSDGIWNAKGASVKIIIKPPFYQTTFFKILLTLLFAFTLYFIYKIRVRYITRQKNKLSKKVKERTEALNQEITERKATEQKLEERQKYLFSILQHTPEAIVVTDPNQIIVEWNPGAEKIFLYSKEEIIGKNLNDLVVGKGKRRESMNLGKKVLAGNLVPPLETIRVDKNGKRINVI
ncbi:MAG: triple tyrosine motif-containing protein, partial [bacterium]